MAAGRIGAVIVAAGRGERAGQSAEGPKQYRRIGGEAVLKHTLRAFLDCPEISPLMIVIHPDDHALYTEAMAELATAAHVVIGGTTRQESTWAGLQALLPFAPDFVHIHDGARPFITPALLHRIATALIPGGPGILPALPVSDTLKQANDTGLVTMTIPRASLHAAQTPQSFAFPAIYAAHQAAHQAGRNDFTDDSALAEWHGIAMQIVMGEADNIKLTWAKDIALADQRLRKDNMMFPDIRTGNGYDVHRLEPGDHVTLCGVRIDHHSRLSGHSDADVALHALTDALLATRGAGDIGSHFPPSDPQWKGADSEIFVRHAVELVRAAGGRIANADITLICEAPKIGPHRAAMTEKLSAILAITADRVSVKATTNEELGFIGRQEGIAAIATATVIYPGEVPE